MPAAAVAVRGVTLLALCCGNAHENGADVVPGHLVVEPRGVHEDGLPGEIARGPARGPSRRSGKFRLLVWPSSIQPSHWKILVHSRSRLLTLKNTRQSPPSISGPGLSGSASSKIFMLWRRTPPAMRPPVLRLRIGPGGGDALGVRRTCEPGEVDRHLQPGRRHWPPSPPHDHRGARTPRGAERLLPHEERKRAGDPAPAPEARSWRVAGQVDVEGERAVDRVRLNGCTPRPRAPGPGPPFGLGRTVTVTGGW